MNGSEWDWFEAQYGTLLSKRMICHYYPGPMYTTELSEGRPTNYLHKEA
jgi:hypothetical protein